MGISDIDIGPVVKVSAESRATDALRESIVTGRIEPGTRITEINLANRMNVSRATVRVALHQLTKEGLVTQVPYTGWKVVSLSAHDGWELYTLRSAIERLASRLVAARVAGSKNPYEVKDALQSAFDRLVQSCLSDDLNAVAEADFELHKTIIELAEHDRLAKQFCLIAQQIRMFIRSSDQLVDDLALIIEQHRPIVVSVLAGDVDEAGRTSEIHNLIEGQKLSDYLLSIEALGENSGSSLTGGTKSPTS